MIRPRLTIVKRNVRLYLITMPLRWNLAKVLAAKGVTPYRLAKLTGLSVPSAYALAKPAVPPSLKTSTLELLCKTLDVTPGELIEYRRR